MDKMANITNFNTNTIGEIGTILNIKECQVFEHQIGGRNHRKKPKNHLFLTYNNMLLKPRAEGNRGDIELAYYKLINMHTTQDAIINIEIQKLQINTLTQSFSSLFNFIPKFHDTIYCEKDGSLQEYLVLSNLCSSYYKPSIADIKIGTQTFDDNAPIEKKEMELKKYPHQSVLGFRFTGMKVYDHTNDTYVEYDKLFCHSLGIENYLQAFSIFFPKESIPEFKSQIEKLLDIFKNNNPHRFIASSLLCIFEGDPAAKFLNPKIYLIDFGHVTLLSPECKDYGVIHGIESILSSLNTILK